ncbi:FMN-dependent NADH-azoreductase [Mycoplasmopsis cynos]|uniref:FMN-dependent NADH-azoreductase n=1 Tax=Mycoplasmopsis cynos TaxID=171284 RepID=UPI002AFEB1B3|nr:FMN-dependent NADH-azoreductase [Mycoplasmopsis cynos]WQQ16675.1 FMN-dependent NADH-azoreductase [Mycoplasmopsis cynos]
MMKKILFLDGSLNSTDQSYSTTTMNYVCQLFDPKEFQVKRVNLNDSKFASNSLNSHTFSTFWKDVESDMWIDELKNTNLLVISLSMTNFGPTSVVKNFIDGIAVANKTFSYKYSNTQDAIGYLTNLNVLVIGSQGADFGKYSWGDHIKWLKETFRFLGAKLIESFDIYGTKVSEVSKMSPSEFVNSKKIEIDSLISKIKKDL